MDKELLNKVRDAVKNIISIMMVDDMFIGLLLKKTWIYADPYSKSKAYADELNIYINPEKFLKLTPEEQRFVLTHELLHILLKHTLRDKEFLRRWGYILDPETLNDIEDAKCNQYLKHFKNHLININPIFPEDIEEGLEIKDVEKKSTEEIIEELARKIKNIIAIITSQGCGNCKLPPLPPWVKIIPVYIDNNTESQKPNETPQPTIKIDVPEEYDRDNDVFRTPKDGDKEGSNEKKDLPVINEGDREDKDAKTPEEKLKRWLMKVSETAITIKTAGLLPGHYEELINELLKPMIDWRRILRSTLTKGIGRNVKRTWSRPSRKIPELYPGKETLKLNKTVVLIDTSGSIGTKELQRFVSEVYGVLREVSKVVVIMWDAEVEDVIELRSNNDIEKVKVIKGRGGTCIKPALELVNKKFNDVDKIIIFSDWEIADLNDAEPLLKKYADKIIAFTTFGRPPKYLESYKIEITD
jgi:predicted metal-dependent peptidase